MINISGVTFNGPILNASGCWCLTKEDMLKISPFVDGIVSKTCTLYPRKANPEPNLIIDKDYTLNCMGIPNLGYSYYRDLCLDKPYILSINGDNIDEVILILEDYDHDLESPRLVEINISCPNLGHSQLLGYSINKLEQFLIKISKIYLNQVQIGLKLPVYVCRHKLGKISNLIKNYNIIKFIVCGNTIPNGLNLNLSQTFGGIGGSKVNKLLGMSNVYQFRQLLSIPIIGCGGIETWSDVEDYLSVGANLVQIGSLFLRAKL